MVTDEWKPTRFKRFIRAVETSTGPAEIMTDAGKAYLKALGNAEGPQVLAAEWIGTAMADYLGLRTFALAQMQVAADDVIPLGKDRMAEAGTAIALRAEPGASWQGSSKELEATVNVTDVGRLIVLDTWLLNCDRFPPPGIDRKPNYDNVFLSTVDAPPGCFFLTAFDHTHCFACGRTLTARLADIGNVKDGRIYGRFPVFDSYLDRDAVRDAVARLGSVDRLWVEEVVGQLPAEWEVPPPVRQAIIELLVGRATFLSASIEDQLFSGTGGQS